MSSRCMEMPIMSIWQAGRFAQATEFVFRSVAKIIYDPLYGRKTQLQVAVSSQDEPGLIDWEDVLNDKKWNRCFWNNSVTQRSRRIAP